MQHLHMLSARRFLLKGMRETRGEQLHALTQEHHVIPSDSGSSVEPTTPAGSEQLAAVWSRKGCTLCGLWPHGDPHFHPTWQQPQQLFLELSLQQHTLGAPRMMLHGMTTGKSNACIVLACVTRACMSRGLVVFCLLVFLLKCSEQPSSRGCQHLSKDK